MLYAPHRYHGNGMVIDFRICLNLNSNIVVRVSMLASLPASCGVASPSEPIAQRIFHASSCLCRAESGPYDTNNNIGPSSSTIVLSGGLNLFCPNRWNRRHLYCPSLSSAPNGLISNWGFIPGARFVWFHLCLRSTQA